MCRILLIACFNLNGDFREVEIIPVSLNPPRYEQEKLEFNLVITLQMSSVPVRVHTTWLIHVIDHLDGLTARNCKNLQNVVDIQFGQKTR